MWFKHALKGKLSVLQNNCLNALFEGATVKLLNCAVFLGQSSAVDKDS